MPIQEFYQGTAIKFLATFTDANNLPIDPTTVTFTVRRPDGTSTNYIYGVATEVTRLSLGNFQAVLALANVGTNYYGWAGTGSVNIYNQDAVLILERI